MNQSRLLTMATTLHDLYNNFNKKYDIYAKKVTLYINAFL